MNVPSKADARLLDVPCDIIASTLNTRLSWLNNAYGRCEKYINAVEVGSDEVYPAIYIGGRTDNSYLLLLPDQDLGNFMFIDVETSQSFQTTLTDMDFDVRVSLIFWFDYRDVYPSDHVNRTIDNIKYDILTEIKKGFKGVKLEPYMVHESSKEIYSTFSTRIADAYLHREGLRSALMRPYGGLRVDCNLRYVETC